MKTIIKIQLYAVIISLFFSVTVFATSGAAIITKEDGASLQNNGSGTSLSFLGKQFFERQIKAQLRRDYENGNLILVNKTHDLPADYVPADLSPILYYANDRAAETRFMRNEAATMFNLMVNDAAKENMQIVMTTAYRSYNFQSVLYNGYVASKGEAAASRTSAKPGQSEHQTGLAVDLSSPSIDNRLSYDFGDIAEGSWIAKNAHKYGFILRYQKGIEDVTGYNYEPWHIRYVGITAATEIYCTSIPYEIFISNLEAEGTFSDSPNNKNVSILTL